MNNHRNYVLASLKTLVLAVLLLAAAFTLYLYIGGFDDVAGLSLDDADLIVELDDVPDDENAFLTFMSATNHYSVARDWRIDLDDNQFLDYGVAFTNEAYYAAKARSLTNAAERADALLASNETFFATMSKGVRQKYYRNVSPRVPPFETFSMPPITTFVAFARLLRLKAQRELERGELDAATDTIAEIHAFGRLVMENEPSCVGYHLGGTIQCCAYGKMRNAMDMGLATDTMLDRFSKLVKADAAAADADVARAIRGEYTTGRSGLDVMTRERIESAIDWGNHALSLLYGIFGCDYSPSWTGRVTEAFYRVILRWPGYMRFALHPRATKARLIQTARRAIAGEGLPSEQMNRTLFAPNCFGNGISYVLGSAVRASGKTASGFRFAQTKTMVILAVEEWRLNNGGGNPPTLDVLVPEFLPKVPVDPWDKEHRPLSYHAADGVVWSVGRLGLFNYIKYLESHPVAKKSIHKELPKCAFRIDGRPF